MDEMPEFSYDSLMPVRLFFAIPVPSAVRDALSGVMTDMRRGVRARVRWAPPEGIHMTLHFLGHQDESIASRIDELVAPLAPQFHAVAARLGSVGFFPDAEHPRVVWVGIEEAGETLPTLHARLGREITRLGLDVDARPWSPHLTIARLELPLPSSAFAARVPDIQFLIDRFCLYRSDLSPGGATYTELRSYPLAAV